MFSTPIFTPRTRTQENKDVFVSRKPGTNNSARKPLGDRSVNLLASGKKPTLTKPELSKVNLKSVLSETQLDTKGSGANLVKDKQAKDKKPKSQRSTTADFVYSLNPIGNPSPKMDAKLTSMILEVPRPETVPDWYGDTCSFDLKDEDVWPKFEYLDHIDNITKSLRPPKTPPLKCDIRFEPSTWDIPYETDWLNFNNLEAKAVDDIPDFDRFII